VRVWWRAVHARVLCVWKDRCEVSAVHTEENDDSGFRNTLGVARGTKTVHPNVWW